MKNELEDFCNFLLKYDLPSRLWILNWVIKLTEAGINVGLPKRLAKSLSIYTTIGTFFLLNQ